MDQTSQTSPAPPPAPSEMWHPAGGASGHIAGDHRTAVIGNATQSFPWASVTKLITAHAALIAVEEGVVSLGDEIRPFRGLTVAHALAHAGGIAFDEPFSIGQPGLKRQYSNAAIRLVADHVQRCAGMPFADYVHIGIIEPLKLVGVRWSDPAAGASGTIKDLLALARELLRPTLIDHDTLTKATQPWWPNLDGIVPGFGMQRPCPWGLGFEIRGTKEPHWMGRSLSPQSFGHFGQSGAMLAVDPARSEAWCSLSPQPFGAWAATAWPAFMDNVVDDLISRPT